MLESKILLNVKGKNIERFLKRLNQNNISLLKLKRLNYNEYEVLIHKKNYHQLLELKTIYEVTEQNIYGIIKIRKEIFKHKFITLFIVLGIILVLYLSNLIFKVEVIHSDSELRNFLIEELKKYEIDIYNPKKSFSELQIIKEEILNNHKDKIEWLEIIQNGTTYTIRVEKRTINEEINPLTNQNIVAAKDAIIMKIITKSGEELKTTDSYVKKGEVVISGNIYLNDQIKNTIPAEGEVYGEVWYTVDVDYPYYYSESYETNNFINTYTFNFLNYNFYSKETFQNKKTEKIYLWEHQILPLSISQDKHIEIVNINQFLTLEQTIKKAYIKAENEISSNLSDEEYIISSRILKTATDEKGVKLTIFFAVCENITAYQPIMEVTDDS